MKVYSLLLVLAAFGSLTLLLVGAKRNEAPRSDDNNASKKTGPRVKELGLVNWVRGFENARNRAEAANKSLLILFQEVPGCATCIGYGEQVLSHPLIVEAIESEFIPLAVYNNIAGDDRATLKSFNEPSWNNPVVRIVTADRKKLAGRLDGDYSQRGLTSAMVTALERTGRPIPPYLRLLHDEFVSQERSVEHATFAMSCFWTGEAEFGALDGVLKTRPGFVNGHEVVDVTFDPAVIPYAKLVQHAENNSCAVRVFTKSKEQQGIAEKIVGNAAQFSNEAAIADPEPKYYLSQTLLRFVPMTETQAARVNAAIGQGRDPKRFLSPRQNEFLRLIKDSPKAGWRNGIGEDFLASWNHALTVAESVLGARGRKPISQVPQ